MSSLSPPGRVSTPTLTPGDRSLTASWSAPNDGGATVTSYNVHYKVTTDSSWTSAGAVSFTTEKEITNLTNGTSYDVQVQACNSAGCGPWSNSATGTPQVKLGTPGGLDVSPLPLRMALLRWDAVSGADSNTSYLIQVKEESGGTWQYPSSGVASSGTTTETRYEIELDKVLEDTSAKGLADADGYQFRVMATDTTGVKLDSGYSDVITIRDNPLLLET